MLKNMTRAIFVAASLAVCFLLQPQHTSAQTENDTEEKEAFVDGGIYDKPFITRLGGRTSIGGYADFEFRTERADGITAHSTFRMHRFNLFTYSVVSDRIRLSSEIEFEDGAEEIKLEYGVIDFEIREELNFRAGIILSPLGKFNLAHDSPVNELTDRPLVVTEIIPSTLSEPGLGFWGSFYPSQTSRITYELYAVNGFNEGIINGATTSTKDGKASLAEDNNNVPAVVGRIAGSPTRGLELGGSFHVGQFNVSSDEGVIIDERRYLRIFGFDWEYRRSRFSFVGEYARAGVDLTPGFTGFLPDSQQGAYAQISYRFLTGLTSTLPSSSMTGVLRAEGVDFDRDATGDGQRRITFGLNFRPVEDTVFKLDFQMDRTTDALNVAAVGRSFLFSVATYF